MGTVKNLLKLKKEGEKKYVGVHPFTTVKKKRNKLKMKILISTLLISTVLVYSFIFYISFIKEEKHQKKVVEKKEKIKVSAISTSVEKKVSSVIDSINIPDLRHKKSTEESLFKKALKAYTDGNMSESLYYIKLILQKKDYIPAILLKAKIFKKEGFEDRARTILEEAYYKYPENKDILVELASIYEKEGALVIAKDMYKTLDELGYIDGTFGLARIYEKLGNKEKALEIYRKLYENPNLTEDKKKEVEKKIILLGK